MKVNEVHSSSTKPNVIIVEILTSFKNFESLSFNGFMHYLVVHLKQIQQLK
jgi:hypothetical protein